MKIGEAIYANQPQQPDAGGDAGGKPGAKGSGDNVVDADFEEVKDDKKKSA
jgi:molecular chaperone DnaK